jgi:hypothetical protein
MDLPRRIVDGGAGDWERSVILSAATDAPSEQSRRNLKRKIGAAAGAAGLTTITASAKSLGAVLLKWLMLGVTVGVVSVGIASYSTRAVEHRASPQQTATAPPGVRQPSVRGEMPAHDPLRSQVSSMAMAAEAPATSGIPASPAHTPPPAANAAALTEPNGGMSRESPAGQSQLSHQSQLSQEIAAIKAARAALASNDATSALSELNRYERTYPAGLFSVEAQVLRIDALVLLGQHSAAQTLALRFLNAQPDSPYARHVRSVASAGTKTNP